MVASPHRKRLNVPLAPLVAGVVAVFTALSFVLLPADLLGNLILDSGIAALVPAAEPPLGFTARAVLILAGGGGLGLIAWFAMFLLVGTRSIAVSGRWRAPKAESGDVPVLRRADAHPDAPARRPLFANSDLGTPFLDVRAPVHVVADVEEAKAPVSVPPLSSPVTVAERELPTNLDQPLADYDPQAIPDEPIAWFEPVAAPTQPQPERRQTFAASERFETFELKPAPRPDADPSASIHALLDRLEKGVVRREPVVAPAVRPRESLQDQLVELRRLATR